MNQSHRQKCLTCVVKMSRQQQQLWAIVSVYTLVSVSILLYIEYRARNGYNDSEQDSSVQVATVSEAGADPYGGKQSACLNPDKCFNNARGLGFIRIGKDTKACGTCLSDNAELSKCTKPMRRVRYADDDIDVPMDGPGPHGLLYSDL